MTKQEFLFALRQSLGGLAEEDLNRSLEFYAEMIDDRMEDGLSEERAVAEIGSVEEISKQILSEIPMAKLVKGRVKGKGGIGSLGIILIILGSPIWASLLIAFAAILFSVYVVIWSLVIVVWAVDLVMAACGVAGIGYAGISLAIGQPLAMALLCVGAGLVCAGLAIYLIFAGKAATRGMISLSRLMWIGTKRMVVGKGDKQ